MPNGAVLATCKPRHRHQEFLSLPREIDKTVSTGLDVHCVVDNHSAHKHPKVKAWLAARPRWHMHFISPQRYVQIVVTQKAEGLKMINTREEIERRLSAIERLPVSAVHHAAGTLTMQFGSLRQVTGFKGAIRYVGQWSLHVQCDWMLDRAGNAIATQADLFGPDENAHRSAQRIGDLLVTHGPAIVESVSGSNEGGAVILLSGGLRLVITPNSAPNEEDWRFFDPTSDAKHFVIEGGKVDPWSLS